MCDCLVSPKIKIWDIYAHILPVFNDAALITISTLFFDFVVDVWNVEDIAVTLANPEKSQN